MRKVELSVRLIEADTIVRNHAMALMPAVRPSRSGTPDAHATAAAPS